eukprot:TRINITY_DN5818_c0_g1_i1.p1 TRINITY_DN5818_c0_g1~~TRINITY_DN5818_c0_g1_i1.p1  ORF type:complete len:384 (+),score=75.26 TRINITY_DN5818_c0_g1_i1:98-1153(+)
MKLLLSAGFLVNFAVGIEYTPEFEKDVKATFIRSKFKDTPPISRDLENQAISESEEKEWFGELFELQERGFIQQLLTCDACWEITVEAERIMKNQLKYLTPRAAVQHLQNVICLQAPGELRLVLDKDNKVLPKYGRGKKAVAGGWPQQITHSACSEWVRHHSYDDLIVMAVDMAKGRQHTRLSGCDEGLGCHWLTPNQRTEAAIKVKEAGYHQPERFYPELYGLPHFRKMGLIPSKKRKYYLLYTPERAEFLQQIDPDTPHKYELTTMELMSLIIEKKNRENRAKALEDDMKLASEKANQRIALQEKIRQMHAKKAEARKKARGEGADEEPKYTVNGDSTEDIKINEDEEL